MPPISSPKPICPACEGTGRSSKNFECVPCKGTGIQQIKVTKKQAAVDALFKGGVVRKRHRFEHHNKNRG